MMIAAAPVPRVSTDEMAAEVDLRDLYKSERRSLVQLAWLLVRDQGEAEELVQEAFVKAYLAWGRLDDPTQALAYLRSVVLNGARSRLRHLRVVERTTLPAPASGESAETAALAGEQHRHMLAALAELPTRQKECVVLRYYCDLSQAEVAAALEISVGSVKTHVHRGLAALSSRLEPQR